MQAASIPPTESLMALTEILQGCSSNSLTLDWGMVATAEALKISPDQHAELESMAKSHTLAHQQACQARALLLARDSVANEEIARRSEA